MAWVRVWVWVWVRVRVRVWVWARVRVWVWLSHRGGDPYTHTHREIPPNDVT